MTIFTSVRQVSAANSDNFYFNHLKASNSGLSYDCIYDIIQDSKGFIWIATPYGLNRYDGTKFETYRKEDLNTDSDFIVTLCEDEQNNIWVGTDSGVAIYDIHTDRFIPFDRPSDKGTVIRGKVISIDKDREGVIWLIVNNQGLFSYSSETGKLKNYFFENGEPTLPANITAICLDSNGVCWISTYFSNLYRADREMKNIVPVSFEKGGEIFCGDNIVRIIEGQNNMIYVATANLGLCEISPQRDKARVLISNETSRFIPEDMFMSRNRDLWIASMRGVYVYNTISGKQRYLCMDKRDPFSIPDNRVHAVYVDDADGIWVGTHTGGVSYAGAFHKNFGKYYLEQDTQLADCLVRGFTEDESGRLWITTDNAGIMIFDPKTGDLQKYKNDRITSICHRICYDQNGQIWLGSVNGLFRLDAGTGKIKTYSHNEQLSHPRYNNICVIRKTSSGKVLVGTTVGLMEYDRRSDSFTALPAFDGTFVTDVIEDAYGDFWIATYADGLIYYNPERGSITRHYTNSPGDIRSLPSNKMRSVFEDRLGRIWATTFGGGFCLFDNQSDSFNVYDRFTLDPVMSDICYRMAEDDNGNLWVPSSRGLICFMPETLGTKVYTTDDGLLNSEFDNHAEWKSEDGTIFLGSADGFIMFNPQKFYTDTKVPEIVITDFYVDETVMRVGDKGSPLKRRIDETRTIELPARQNSFGFGFALLGFASPAGNTVFCMLEGFDGEWQKTSADNTVFYSNIPAGRYTLKIKGVNSSGIWNEQHSPIEISVKQKFYKSASAILLYIVFLILLIVFCVQYLYRKALKREQARQKEYERAREIELFDEKMLFFSDVIHEIKTPLTLIRAPMHNILSSEECSPGIMDDLKIVSNSTDYLIKLVNELLDFVRLERRGYILERQDIDLVEKIDFLCFNFTETAKSNGVDLSFVRPEGHVFVNADESGLMKILYNLFHNAVKYAGTYIEVEINSDERQVRICFRNDGQSIPGKYRQEIFKPFVQLREGVKRPNTGVGIGLSLARTIAELHGGMLELADDTERTEFILTLPVGQNPVVAAAETDEYETQDEAQHVVRLLVVEDNSELSAYVKRKLQPEYKVLLASTAERALELLRQHNIDLVVTDIALGKMNGLELCRTVCSDFELSHIPVIVLSALSTQKSKMTAMENGASLYIEKPFNMDYLQACIKSLLDKRIVIKGAYRNNNLSAVGLNNLPGSNAEFLRQLDQFIMANISDPDLSNELLAGMFCLSKSTLMRKVKGLLDTTPNDYIRNKRLAVAARMLAAGQHRINEVCYSVGFNTPSYFAKCFKKHYGMLPAEYMGKHTGRDMAQD